MCFVVTSSQLNNNNAKKNFLQVYALCYLFSLNLRQLVVRPRPIAYFIVNRFCFPSLRGVCSETQRGCAHRRPPAGKLRQPKNIDSPDDAGHGDFFRFCSCSAGLWPAKVLAARRQPHLGLVIFEDWPKFTAFGDIGCDWCTGCFLPQLAFNGFLTNLGDLVAHVACLGAWQPSPGQAQ